MKNQKGLTTIGAILLVIIIASLVFGGIYYFRLEAEKEKVETLKTDMLLIQAKVKSLSSEQILTKKDNMLVGTKISKMKENEVIKEFLEKKIIDINSKKNNFYVITNQNLEEIELSNISIEDGTFYIVDYKTNEVYYTKGILYTDGQTYYKISDLENVDNNK